jgi:hypothetical protein
MKSLALSLLAPLVVGPLSFALMQSLKRLSAVVDALPPVTKRFAVTAIAIGLTVAGRVAGIEVPCEQDVNCLPALTQDSLKAILAASLAFILHWLKQQKAKQ